ncbi:MAG: ABC transporter substrate-binding protein [Oscillospiraceae bacterium]|nr:ABC transporter substrate-binding protein [Oscillospiraceae bacterium]
MKKYQAILALVLIAALLAALFAGCAKTAQKNETSPSQTSTNVSNDPAPAASSGESDDKSDDAPAAQPEEVNPEDVVDIKVYFLDILGNYEKHERVEALMNEISVPAIGVSADWVFNDMGSAVNNTTLAFSSGDQMDVLAVHALMGLTKLYSQNMLMEADDLYQEYAAEALSLVSRYADAWVIDGGRYGIPANRVLANSPWLIMRKDVLEATGQLEAAESADSWSDIESIFAAVKDYCGENNMSVIGGQKGIIPLTVLWSGDSFDTGYAFDRMGDTTGMLLVDQDTDQYSLLPADERVIAMRERAVQWVANGWVWPDTMLGDDHSDNVMKQGVIFCKHDTGEANCPGQKSEVTGYACIGIKEATGVISTSLLNGWGMAVASVCENPVEAVKYINLCFTSKEMNELITWGEYGVDWVLQDDGQATYPEGADITALYHSPDYQCANQMLIAPWVGSGADFREIAQAENATAPVSPYMGFLINTGDLQTYIASISAVTDEFNARLNSGYYTDELQEEFLAKLQTAGVDEYIQICQGQLDAWLAENR